RPPSRRALRYPICRRTVQGTCDLRRASRPPSTSSSSPACWEQLSLQFWLAPVPAHCPARLHKSLRLRKERFSISCLPPFAGRRVASQRVLLIERRPTALRTIAMQVCAKKKLRPSAFRRRKIRLKQPPALRASRRER